MSDFPKFLELFRTFRDSIVANSSRISLNAVDRDGSDANLIGAGGAAMGEEVTESLSDVNEGFWLDSARGPKLDRLVWDRYSMTRLPAAPSFVFVQFSCATPNPLAFAINSGTKLSTADGVEFVTVSGATFPLSSTGPVAVLCRSSLAGSDRNVDAGTLQSITSQIANMPANLVANNAAAASGGANAELDSALRARARKFWSAARRGTKAAIELGALSVPGVVSAAAFEGLTGPANPSRMVSLVVTDAFTDALVKQGQTVSNYATKSQAFAVQVLSGLDEFRAFGIPVFVTVAQVAMVSVVLRLRYLATAASDIDYINSLARTAMVEWVNQLSGGDTLDPQDLLKRLRAIPGLDIRGDEVASPPGSIVPGSPYRALRTSGSLVAIDGQATLAATAPQFLTPGAQQASPI